MTYSSACQRVSQLMRLPTFTFPATAPTLGLTKCRTSLLMASGSIGGVRINGHDDAAGSLGQGMRKRGRFSAIGLVNNAHGGIAAELRIEQFAGAVGRSVVHDDHFQLRVVGLQHGIDRVDDDVFLVVGGNQHAHQRLKIRLIGRQTGGTFR